MVPVPGVGRGCGAGGGGAPPGQHRSRADDNPCPNPLTIQRLQFLPGENTHGVWQNIALTILGGTAFCKRCRMGFSFFDECPRKGSYTHPLRAILN